MGRSISIICVAVVEYTNYLLAYPPLHMHILSVVRLVGFCLVAYRGSSRALPHASHLYFLISMVVGGV
jgi:hypothetical protein